MLYWIVIGIHVIVSLVLIAVILLQAGRGGGLSEAFGASSSTQTILGTKANVFLKRATEVAAVVYILTCLSLAVMTSHRGRSLVSSGSMMPAATEGAPAAQQPLADDVDF